MCTQLMKTIEKGVSVWRKSGEIEIFWLKAVTEANEQTLFKFRRKSFPSFQVGLL